MLSRALIALVVSGSVAAGARAQLPLAVDVPRVWGTEVSSEYSWERRTGISLDSHTAVFGTEPFHITLSITYEGLKQSRIPESVDVVLVRESPSSSDVAVHEQAAMAIVIIDGLPAPLTRQAGDGPDRINAIVPFEIFQWMVGGDALEFEAFGRRFVLAARQITFLKQTALEWAHPR